jgi:Fe-S-cluster-containing dehydrogenase component/DMSO reductase anchor subunit
LDPNDTAVIRLPLIENYLREQSKLTAVERFSQHHARLAREGDVPRYRELLPVGAPSAGKQLAFEVDLDVCTGCKACVTACHSLNGLDEGESWRFVGLLHGGTPEKPVQQTVTSSCHHCADPACLNGCPVNAYEKDPVTGIVKHLDDQCIGCKYCTLTCPYEVPQYNAHKGIVRKCDMCSERLAEGEAPACVQACPNEAIRIAVVDRAEVLENAQGDAFLPGAPSPGITVPTTVYKTARALPRNLLPADFYAVRPSEQHRPLVAMLVLTQLSVGAFCVEQLARSMAGSTRFVHAALSLAVGLLALGASMLHLGRPLYAFRAVLGLRRSWLSREILVFGVFAGLACAHAGWLWYSSLQPAVFGALAATVSTWLGALVSASGLLGVFCSAMVYAATLKRFWSFAHSAARFFTTTAALGVAATLAAAMTAAALEAEVALGAARSLCIALISISLLELGYELSLLAHLGDKRQSELKRSALLLTGELAGSFRWRLAAGTLGGVVLPLVLLARLPDALGAFELALAFAALLLALAGELLERLLFFAAVSSPKMPGALR